MIKQADSQYGVDRTGRTLPKAQKPVPPFDEILAQTTEHVSLTLDKQVAAGPSESVAHYHRRRETMKAGNKVAYKGNSHAWPKRDRDDRDGDY